MERPRYSHYEDANLYEVDLESYAEYADHKIIDLQSQLRLAYWYYCNSTSCEGIDSKKLLEYDKQMEEYEKANDHA